MTFYVAVPDVEEALQQAESLGGQRVMGPEEIMGMVVLGQFNDPEGNLVGVVKDRGASGRPRSPACREGLPPRRAGPRGRGRRR